MILPVPIPVGSTKDLETKVAAQQRELTELRKLVQQLDERLDRQGLVLRALCRVVQEAQGLNPRQLLDRVRQEETERASAPPRTCPKCGKVVTQRTNRCIYCGEVREMESVLELF